MTKINGNFFSKAKEKLNSDKTAYIKIKLELSKKFFLFISSIYFFLYISVLSSFLIEYTSVMSTAFFPVFVFASFVLVYDAISYILMDYSEKLNVLRIPILVICGIMGIGITLLYYIF